MSNLTITPPITRTASRRVSTKAQAANGRLKARRARHSLSLRVLLPNGVTVKEARKAVFDNLSGSPENALRTIVEDSLWEADRKREQATALSDAPANIRPTAKRRRAK